MFTGRNKTRLKELRKQLERLIGDLPPEARALVNEANALKTDIDVRLGPLSLPVTARERADFESGMEGLKHRADTLQALRQEAAPVLQAEKVHAAEVAGFPDPGLRQVFADRSAERNAVLAAIGREESATDDARQEHLRIKHLDAGHKVDRAFFHRYVKARECLRGIRSEDRTRDLEEALPGLQRRFIEEGPSADLLTDLRSLLDPLDRFRQRPKPERIDEVYHQIRDIEEWINVLYEEDDNLTPGTAVAGHQNELQSLTGDYWHLTGEWQNHDDEVFNGLFERAETLMRELTEQAEREYGHACKRLERNRKIYDQYGDPQFNPGLAEEMAALLVERPDTPYAYDNWRDRYRRAIQGFADALGGDTQQLLGIRDTVRGEIIDALTRIRELSLSKADNIDLVALDAELKDCGRDLSEEAPIEAVIDSLDLHRNLAERIDALAARASKQAGQLAADRQSVRDHASRLGELARALAVTPPQSLDLRRTESTTSLELGYEALDRERAALAEVESDLLAECCSRLEQQLLELREVRTLLDDDLDLGDAELPAGGLSTPPTTLEEAEILLAELEPARQRLLAALEQQLERLRSERKALLGRPVDSTRNQPGSDHNLLEDLLQPLRDLDESRFSDRRELVRRLRHLLHQAKRHTDKMEHAEKTIADLRRDVGDRLHTLSREFSELELNAHHQRVASLIKKVDAASASREARLEQIQCADRLLRALERHAHRRAAHNFTRDLKILRKRGIKDTEGSDFDTWLQQPDRHLKLPDDKVRQQARELAERHSSAR